jgi:hypothetical protein
MKLMLALARGITLNSQQLNVTGVVYPGLGFRVGVDMCKIHFMNISLPVGTL